MQKPSANLKRVIRGCEPGSNLATRALGRMISEVPGLSVRLETYIKGFYGWLGGDMSDPVRAAAVLGPRVIGSVAVQHAVVLAVEETPILDHLMSNIWSDCLRRGLAARLLSQQLETSQVDVAFTTGLMLEFPLVDLLERQDLGLRWAQSVRPALGRERLANEARLFGISARSGFGAIAQEWGLLGEIVVALSCYYEGKSHANADIAGLVRILRFADSLGESLTASASGPALESWVVEVREELGIQEADAWKLIANVLKQTKTIAPSLGISVCEQPSVDDLRRCRESSRSPDTLHRVELVQWALILQENMEAIERRGEELKGIVETLRSRDDLTNLATHRAFIDRLEKEVQQARKTSRNFFALLVDIDDFSNLNTQYGFSLGDEVLRRVAELLKRQLGESAMIARVGPDSFGLIVVGAEREGRLHAERVRAGVEQLRIDVERQRIRVSCRVSGVSFNEMPASAGYANINAELYRLMSANPGANRSYWKESR